MSTSLDNSRGRRAAHFSESSNEASTSRPRRSATPRSATGRSERSSSGAPARVPGPSATQMSERTARATRRAAAAHARRAKKARSSSRRRALPPVSLLAFVIVAAVVVIGVWGVPRLFQHSEPQQEGYPAGEEVVVTIPEGAGGSQIAQILIENHVISDEAAFYQEIQKQHADAKMKSGTYLLITGGTPSEVVRQLVSGPNATQFQLKLAEGLTLERTAAAVEEQLGVPADEFVEQAKASNYQDSYDFLADVGDDSLEGFLFAKTYDLGGKEATADMVIRTMLNQYQSEVGTLDMETARAAIRERYGIEISDYGLLKVASIIEKEAVTDEDRPLVASVIYNRLSIGMAIQSDATMMYVTGGEVTASDLQIDSPYNTYLNNGLTPTPICSPSMASIVAAMEPADTEYLYFFINDKVHQFSVTYEEHQQAISESVNG